MSERERAKERKRAEERAREEEMEKRGEAKERKSEGEGGMERGSPLDEAGGIVLAVREGVAVDGVALVGVDLLAVHHLGRLRPRLVVPATDPKSKRVLLVAINDD